MIQTTEQNKDIAGPSRKVFLTTLGCKLNQYDSEMVLTQFRAAGFESVDDPAQADINIVNTCSVTATAERKARNALRSLVRRNPNAKLIATGCMAERAPETLSAIQGVNLVAGNKEKERIVELAGGIAADDMPAVAVGETADAAEWTDSTIISGLLGRTRAYLKVQDGCSQHCTYCIVPRLRGRGRSQTIASARERAERLVERGFEEIVLTGVALGTYGFDLELEDGLAMLLEELETLPGLHRIRMGSVEPWAVTDRFLQAIARSRILCPHLHIPLQSCSDSVLRRMNRRYDMKQIRHLLDYAFSLRDDWGLGSDIIVGFPGESEEQFVETLEFLQASRLSYLHVFPYSSRPGTPATRLPGHVSAETKLSRVERMKQVDADLRKHFRRRHLDTTVEVLLEDRTVDGLLAGHTANYLDVYIPFDASLIGKRIPVHIYQLHDEGVFGAVTDTDHELTKN